jgi:hypothetical protein
LRRFASIALLPVALFMGLSPLLGQLGSFAFHAHGSSVHIHAGGSAAHAHTADHTHDAGWAAQAAVEVDADAHRREHAQQDRNEIFARMVPVGGGAPAAPAEPEPAAPVVPSNDQVPLDDEAPAPTYCSLSQTDLEPVCVHMPQLPVAVALLVPVAPESPPASALITGASGRAPPSGPLLQA